MRFLTKVDALTLTGPIAAIADPHLVTKGLNDDSSEVGIRWALYEAMKIPGLQAFMVLGDFIDAWLAPWTTILYMHRHILIELDEVLTAHDVLFIPMPGNHDNVNGTEMARRLRVVMPNCRMASYDLVVVNYILCAHGELWDKWNRPGPLRVVARAATAFAGGLEYVFGIDESWINPTRLTSPGRMQNAARQAAIEEAADRYIRRYLQHCHVEGIQPEYYRVMHGHTHRRRQSPDRRVICPGSCTHGRGEMVVIWPDGTVNLLEMNSGLTNA